MIKKPNEMNFSNKKLCMIIAGVPGIGKTTFALSSPKPLLIDLDKGVSRVETRYRKDTLFVEDFYELEKDLKNADLSEYETIVIDTGGKLFEMLKPVVIKEDSKNGKRDGNLSLQGYGAVKRKFKSFVNFIKSLDKHLIFVFHATEVLLTDDVTGLRIRIEGSSKDEIWDDVDIGGFMEISGKKRTIGFSNCERYYAKGTHGIHGVYEIPELSKSSKNNFLTILFSSIINDLNEEVIELREYEKLMYHFLPQINVISNKEELNDVYKEIVKSKHFLTSKDELWSLLNDKAKSLNLKYEREKNMFE